MVYKKTKFIHVIFLLMCFQIYTQEVDFTYREPYFLEINTPEFSLKENTNRLDDEWGIWGHNLPKLLKKSIEHTNKVYALIDGVRNEKQLCFSSVELEDLILEKVEASDKQNFVIAPNDNSLSCQCSKCKKVGNTYKKSSPAVFTMLNELASKKPNSNFYTLVYSPVKEVPNFELEENVGVLFSTIDYQKGVTYEEQKKFKKLKRELLQWKAKVNRIIIWDYALNFDNYHDFYPVLSTIQKNLIFFKSINIQGVFFNGSEVYAVFQELKSTILSKLLVDVSINLEQEIECFFKKKYPEKIADLLITYYLNIEREFRTSKKHQGIYSNIKKAEGKYLKHNVFLPFYNKLLSEVKLLKQPSNNVKKLLLSTIFIKLELIRVKGVDSIEKSTKKDVFKMLSYLKKLSVETNVLYLNESKSTLKEYITLWQKKLLRPVYNNKLKVENLKVQSALDEGYTDTSVLIDAKDGFLDYGVNWFIVSKDDLVFQLHKDIEKGDELLFNFLNDPKHHIYYPEKIFITINNKKSNTLEKSIKTTIKKDKKRVLFKFNKTYNNSTIIITIKRRINKHKSAIACDEIILR